MLNRSTIKGPIGDVHVVLELVATPKARAVSPRKAAGLVAGILLSLSVAYDAHAQIVVNTDTALADGRTLSLRVVNTAQGLTSVDPFDAFLRISGVEGEPGPGSIPQSTVIEVLAFPMLGASKNAALVSVLLASVGIATGTTVENAIKIASDIGDTKLVVKHVTVLQSMTTDTAGMVKLVAALAEVIAGPDSASLVSELIAGFDLPNPCDTP